MNTSRSQFFLGVDLGQSQDPTAIALVERNDSWSGQINAATYEKIMNTEYRVMGLGRLPLGTRYPDVVDRIVELTGLVTSAEPPSLIVDATGVGAPVVDMLRGAVRGVASIVPVVFTSGGSVRCENGVYRVPKKDLVHGLIVLFQQGMLRVVEHPLRDTLVAELRNMRMKITSEDHTGFEAWRQGQHDDMVFAVSLACWAALRAVPPVTAQQQPLLWY